MAISVAMALNYNTLQKQPKNFTQLTGLTIIGFKKIVEQVRGDWLKIKSSKKAMAGSLT